MALVSWAAADSGLNQIDLSKPRIIFNYPVHWIELQEWLWPDLVSQDVAWVPVRDGYKPLNWAKVFETPSIIKPIWLWRDGRVLVELLAWGVPGEFSEQVLYEVEPNNLQCAFSFDDLNRMKLENTELFEILVVGNNNWMNFLEKQSTK